MFKNIFLNKKGFDVQFNWIFVMIAGAVFIGFFVSMIMNQTAQQTESGNQVSTQDLDSWLKVSSAVANSQNTHFFDKKIIFSCGETSEYFVTGSLKSSRYDYNAIFSPSELDGNEIIVLTLMFEAPFKVMPLIYVTNKNVEYVFVGSSPTIIQLYNMMPINATKKLISVAALSGYPYNNFDKTVFVVNDSTALAKIPVVFNNRKGRVFAVMVLPDQGVGFNFNRLSFYNSSFSGFVKDDDSALFLDAPLALGGIIGYNKPIYECNLRKVLGRLELLSQLHKDRLDTYTKYYEDNPYSECKNYYFEAKNYAERIQNYSIEKEELSSEDFRNLSLAIHDLTNLNNHILTSTDCPRIY